MVKGIEPGSVPYGERQGLEDGLRAAAPAGGEAPVDRGASVPAPPPVDSAGDPLAALINGAVSSPRSGPLTAGLSVGPGAGRGGQITTMTPEQSRLHQVAAQAKNPILRQMARNELRRIAGESF